MRVALRSVTPLLVELLPYYKNIERPHVRGMCPLVQRLWTDSGLSPHSPSEGDGDNKRDTGALPYDTTGRAAAGNLRVFATR